VVGAVVGATVVIVSLVPEAQADADSIHIIPNIAKLAFLILYYLSVFFTFTSVANLIGKYQYFHAKFKLFPLGKSMLEKSRIEFDYKYVIIKNSMEDL